MKFSLIPLVAAITLTSHAYADNVEETVLPQVVVSASRLPETAGIASSHIQTISSDEIRKSGARNLSDLLRQVAVIQLVDAAGDGNSPSLGMRGFGENAAQNSLLLLDGRRLNNDTDIGTPDLNNLSIDDIDHIEIINGSAGALYGAGAVGGIVNIITKSISRNLQVGTSIGSDKLIQYRIRAGERAGAFGIQATGEKTLTDNYRDQNAVNDEFGQARLTWDNATINAYVESSRQNRYQQFPGSLFMPAYQQNRKQASNAGDYIDGTSERFNAGARISIADNWTLKLDGSQRKDESTGQLTAFGSSTPTAQSRKQESLNPQISGVTDLGDIRLKVVAGFDGDSADYRYASNMGKMSNDIHTRSGYAQLGFGFGDTLEVVTGARHAKYRSLITDDFTYPAGLDLQDTVNAGSLGIYWSPTSSTTLWLRGDENFRFALIDEQTVIAFGAAPLRTQEGVSYETGIKIQSDNLSTTLQAYQIDLESEISFDPNSYANINLDDTMRRGGSLGINYKLLPTLSLNGQLAYVNATFTAGPYDGKRIPMVARENATLGINWEAFTGFTTSLEQQRLGKRHVGGDYANTFAQLPTLHLVNLGLNYRIQNLDSSLRINNVFNKEYAAYATTAPNPFPTIDVAYMPAPERNMVLSLTYRFF